MTELWSLPDDPLVGDLVAFAAQHRLAERARDLDRRPAFPAPEFRAMGDAGWLGLSRPVALGGRGLPLTRTGVLLFHLARGAGTVFAKLALQPEFASVLGDAGGADLVRTWYTPLVRGQKLIGNQITEPGAGSDATALALTATPDGNDYLLDGEKSEVAFAIDADAALVYGRRPGTSGAEGISAFLVPQDLPGVERSLGAPDLGERWQRRGSVRYRGVRVPSKLRLGAEGEGFRLVLPELSRERALLAAIYLGVARASWEETVAYVGDRAAFGGRLSDQQSVAHPLAQDGARLTAAWLLVRETLHALDAGARATAETALAKELATEFALRTIDHAVQFHGGRGYSGALPHEQRWRDVRSGPIAHGPSELLLRTAARRLWPHAPDNP